MVRRRVEQQRFIHKIFVLMSILLLAVMSVFYIWLKVKVGLLATELEHLRKDKVQILQQNYNLKGELVHLTSYERITNIAQDKLGMIFIQQEVISTENDGQKSE